MNEQRKVSPADLYLLPLMGGGFVSLLRLPLTAAAAAIITSILLLALRFGFSARSESVGLQPHALLFGFLVVVLPVVGAGALLPVTLVFLCTERRGIRWDWIRPWLPLLLVAIGWLCSEFYAEREWETIGF